VRVITTHHHHRHGVALRREEEKMIRTRLLWFSLGFTTSAAVVSHFVWKDLWVDRHALSSHVTQQFDALQTRISNLESNFQNHTPVSSNHDQVFPLIESTTNSTLPSHSYYYYYYFHFHFHF